jgi:hypothetical protein
MANTERGSVSNIEISHYDDDMIKANTVVLEDVLKILPRAE